jgi:hypothetical protein
MPQSPALPADRLPASVLIMNCGRVPPGRRRRDRTTRSVRPR